VLRGAPVRLRSRTAVANHSERCNEGSHVVRLLEYSPVVHTIRHDTRGPKYLDEDQSVHTD
jgi:hypothetical protein